MRDKKLRYEDAINSVRCALELGTVPGGGACLLHLANNHTLRKEIQDLCTIDSTGSRGDGTHGGSCDGDVLLGVEVFLRSLSAPLRQIAINAGQVD